MIDSRNVSCFSRINPRFLKYPSQRSVSTTTFSSGVNSLPLRTRYHKKCNECRERQPLYPSHVKKIIIALTVITFIQIELSFEFVELPVSGSVFSSSSSSSTTSISRSSNSVRSGILKPGVASIGTQPYGPK
ncbi:hypothetical protein D3C76_1044340 [compost metagenome]